MPGEIRRVVFPFGALKPDEREFANDGLTQALNVVPLGGTYAPSRFWLERSAAIGGTGVPRGLHVHRTDGNSWRGYFGTYGELFEVSDVGTATWTLTDKSRAVGGPYSAIDVGAEFGWQGASFGDSVVMTDFFDDPQLLVSPTSANFVKLAQSGGGNPGMDPKAKFVYQLRGNLHLANISLAASFLRADGTTELAAGAYPVHVCWSQTENLRQFGSFRATPQLTGCGLQPLNYDLGHIVGVCGGTEYALIAMQQGWVREDGPPYTFRPISQGIGCQFPNTIIRFDEDVYFFGPSGPMVLRGGEGPAEPLTRDRISRTLFDQVFGGKYAIQFGADPVYFSAGSDQVTRTVWWAFTSNNATFEEPFFPFGNMIVVYDVDRQLFSFIEPRREGESAIQVGATFIRTRPEQLEAWTPGRDLVTILTYPHPSSGIAVNVMATPFASTLPVAMTFEKGFLQLAENVTTRIMRVRPIYALTSGATPAAVVATVTSKNKPFEADAVSKPFSAADTHGWITTPSTVFADFHRPALTISAISGQATELEAIEIEFVTGGPYSA